MIYGALANSLQITARRPVIESPFRLTVPSSMCLPIMPG